MSSVRAFLPSSLSDKGIFGGFDQSRIRNPKESSHGVHGGEPEGWRSQFGFGVRSAVRRGRSQGKPPRWPVRDPGEIRQGAVFCPPATPCPPSLRVSLSSPHHYQIEPSWVVLIRAGFEIGKNHRTEATVVTEVCGSLLGAHGSVF
jgi:hypothetical protein